MKMVVGFSCFIATSTYDFWALKKVGTTYFFDKRGSPLGGDPCQSVAPIDTACTTGGCQRERTGQIDAQREW
jgi:hypothetical protein